MTIRDCSSDADFSAASRLAAENHGRLRAALPFLPERSAEGFEPKIRWIRDKGALLGGFEGEKLLAFMGGFVIEDFRNAGPGAFCPDWCHGAAKGTDSARASAALYRAIMPRWIGMGARLHSIALYSSCIEALEALSLLGFGRIVMDAARPVADLGAELRAEATGKTEEAPVRRAGPEDAKALAGLDALLASHIASPPVLMPGTHGSEAAEWKEWFGGKDAVAFIASDAGGRPLGFIKAEEPQIDVSDAVHSERTLAIDGMFVLPGERRAGIGRALLSALAAHAEETGKTLMSVDCETLNPEAYGFWSKRFEPVSWCLERRV